MSGPADLLVPPSDAEVIPDLAELIISGMGTILSPTGWVRTIVDMVFDWDPLTEVWKVFAGEWNKVAQASRGYEILADFAAEVGEEVSVQTRQVLADWEGNAADAASGYMTETLVPALEDLASAIQRVGNEYRAVSVGMHRTAMLANSAFNTVIDWIIYTAAIAAATAASSWTGVGAVVGGGATAAAVARTLVAVSSASSALTAGQAIIDGAAGIIPGYLGAINGFRSVDLPGGYDNAQVER